VNKFLAPQEQNQDKLIAMAFQIDEKSWHVACVNWIGETRLDRERQRDFSFSPILKGWQRLTLEQMLKKVQLSVFPDSFIIYWSQENKVLELQSSNQMIDAAVEMN